MEFIGSIIAAVLTVMVFSYIFGDNILFRLASHIFVGVAVGYAVITVWYEVFAPALSSGQTIIFIPAVLFCLLLLLKIKPNRNALFNALGNIPLALIIGVGAALTVGGALFGTLIPQVMGSIVSLSPNMDDPEGAVVWLNNIIILLGTIGTLFYFTFAVKAPGFLGGFREGVVRFFAGMGRLMIIFTLGALFANTVSSRVALLVSRIQFLATLFGG